MYCRLCNFNTNNNIYFIQHCKTKSHIQKEDNILCCIRCDKEYKKITTLNNHRKNIHTIYKKDNINNSMWLGPLDNSLPKDSIPLRMVNLGNDLRTLLGVGYDNKLYIKNADEKNLLGITKSVNDLANRARAKIGRAHV